jgi:cholera toxin transcriptional activator
MRSIAGGFTLTEIREAGRTFRFGMFELDEASGELRKGGKSQPRLRDQALRILLVLLGRPRELVTREELRERLWSSDTFVDFDHGLNTAINQLRGALGDSASNPRFIETLPRRGYRFVAPVEGLDLAAGHPLAPPALLIPSAVQLGSPVQSATQSKAPDALLVEAAASSLLSHPAELPRVSGGIVRILFGAIQLLYLSFYVVSLVRLSKVDEILAASGDPATLILVVLIATAAAGIPIRLYLLAAVGFNYRGLSGKFLKLFPFLLPLDELWALAPFLIVQQIGIGAAIGTTAALLYLPFAQRSLLLMGFSADRAQE